jgi:hypothetical protein
MSRPNPRSYTSPSKWNGPDAQQALLTLSGLRPNHMTNNRHFMEHKAFTISSLNIQGLRSSAFGHTDCALGYIELVVQSTKYPGVEQEWDSGGMLIRYRADLTHSITIIKTGTFLNLTRNSKGNSLNREKCSPVCYLYTTTRIPIL